MQTGNGGKAYYKNVGTEPWSSAGRKTKGDGILYRALKRREREISRKQLEKDSADLK